jgi:hypothetical protein
MPELWGTACTRECILRRMRDTGCRFCTADGSNGSAEWRRRHADIQYAGRKCGVTARTAGGKCGVTARTAGRKCRTTGSDTAICE